jgi:hypothetical protein
MYSFAQRQDVRVVDEPLYGHYLRVSGAEHPGGDEVIAKSNCDGDAVMQELLALSAQIPETLFIKHMAHHLVQIDLQFLRHTRNVFLVRDPREMLPSLTIQVPHASLADTGLKRQCELLRDLQERGQPTVVLDSRELLLDPESVLRELCARLDLPFEKSMLQWPAGPRAEDGVWARHWYHAVHKSTGFAKYQPKHDFPAALQALLEECQPWYNELFARAIRAPASGD